MAVKMVLVLCACVGLAIGAAIEPSANSELPSNPASNIPGVSLAEGFVKIPISIAKGFAEAVQGASVSRPKRQVSNPASAFQEFANSAGNLSSGSQSPSNIASNIPGVSEIQNAASGAQGFSGIASSVANGFANAAKGVAGRFQDAFNATYQDERNSVSDSFNSVKDQIKQNVDTGANLTKTAFDLGTVVPKFGKNLIIGGN